MLLKLIISYSFVPWYARFYLHFVVFVTDLTIFYLGTQKLFEDYRKEHFDIEDTLSASKILQEEVQTAIAQLKDDKASGPDNIKTEHLKLFD